MLRAVAEKLSALDKPPLKPTELLPHISGAIGDRPGPADAILRQCVSLNGLMRQIGLNHDEIVEGLRFGLLRDSEWSDEQHEQWRQVENAFGQLLCVDAFRIVAKAIDLAYEYANLYRKSRILTDIRPLFSENAETIDGAVVSYTLRIRYDSVDGDHELSIAMDDADVRELRDTCDRAMLKAKTAHEWTNEKFKVSTVISGRSESD